MQEFAVMFPSIDTAVIFVYECVILHWMDDLTGPLIDN